MPDLPRYTQRGRVQYDYAVTGIGGSGPVPVPLLAAQSADYPYLRETSGDSLVQQVDTSGEPGEQSLGSFWLRSQSTFDGGAFKDGDLWLDVAKGTDLFNRFAASAGVDPSVPGRVSLIHRSPRALSLATGNTPVQMVGVSAGGFDGVVLAYQSGTGVGLQRVSSTGAATVIGTIAAATLFSMCSDGGAIHVLTSIGVHRFVIGTWTIAQTYTGPVAQGVIGYAKDRLVLSSGNKLIELTATAPTPAVALPAPFWTSPSPSWRAVAVADGPESIYVGTRDGARSTVLGITLDTSAVPPTLAYPAAVADLPTGEVLLSMLVYMGTYVLMGTSEGVRIGGVRDGGGILTGPITVYSDRPVASLHARGESVYATGAVVQEQTGPHTYTARDGIYRIDLGRTTDSDATRYAWATFLWAESLAAGPGAAAVAPLGQSGRMALAVPESGVYVEHATDVVPTGWLRTGRMRMGTLEDKVFQLVKVSDSVQPGLLQVWAATESEQWEMLHAWDSSDIRAVEVDGPDADPHLFLQLEFVLGTKDGVLPGPVLTGYQVKASPSGIVNRTVRLTALCYPRESDRNSVAVERPTWDRVAALEAAQKKGAMVLLQDFGAGTEDYCLIKNLQMISTHIPESPGDRANLGMLLLVTLEVV
jgi:hypothetical protein